MCEPKLWAGKLIDRVGTVPNPAEAGARDRSPRPRLFLARPPHAAQKKFPQIHPSRVIFDEK